MQETGRKEFVRAQDDDSNRKGWSGAVVETDPAELDRSVVERLVRLGGNPLARTLVGRFVDSAPGVLEAMKAACRSGDLESVAGAARTLVSSAGNVGAIEVSRRAREIEESFRSGAPDVTVAVADLAVCCASAVEMLQTLAGELTE